MTPSPLGILAICRATAGKEEQLKAAQRTLVADTHKEPGCIRYELHQSAEDPALLVFVETWASKETWLTHMEAAGIKRFKAAAEKDNLLAEITIHQLNLVDDGK